MAGDSYPVVKALRAMGVDAELVIPSWDFGMSNPLWETHDLQDYDPYHFDFKRAYDEFGLPEWVKVWWVYKSFLSPKSVVDLFQITKRYDLTHAHPFWPIYLQFSGRPTVIFESGWIRSLIQNNTHQAKLGRRAYHKAEAVTFNNPDTYPMIMATRPKMVRFIPFAISDIYKPSRGTRDTNELVFFHPARHFWGVKGNDILIRAFKRFVNSGRLGRLKMVEWGEDDLQKSKKLVIELGLERLVDWVKPMSKPSLIRAYDECDVVLDQVILGVGGTAFHEGMGMGKPVIIYLNGSNEKFYGEMPPGVNARTELEVFNAMARLQDPNLRLYHGELGLRFVTKHNRPDMVAKQMLDVYEEVLKSS